MFVTAVAQLAVPMAVAQDRLLTLLHADGGLRDAASAAFRAGETVLLRAGFAGVSKQIAVHSVPAYLRGDTTVIPVRWVATGPADQLLPAMDANLELDPTPDGHSRLTLSGNYRPPLGTARRQARAGSAPGRPRHRPRFADQGRSCHPRRAPGAGRHPGASGIRPLPPDRTPMAWDAVTAPAR